MDDWMKGVATIVGIITLLVVLAAGCGAGVYTRDVSFIKGECFVEKSKKAAAEYLTVRCIEVTTNGVR